MPELPEVETVRQGLTPVWQGRRFTRVTCYRPNLRLPFPDGFAQILTGRVVDRLERRAKYLLIHLSDRLVLIIHLGMSGHMTINPQDDGPIGPHDHVVFITDQGVRVTYTDPRRFGLMTLVQADQLDHHKLFAGLGPEPLDAEFTAQALGKALANRMTPIKSALLDQKNVAGLGNIYVCESLFRAKIHPERLAHSLTKPQLAKLVATIKAVLSESIAAGGTTLRDHLRPDGQLGYFKQNLSVYDHEGEPCPVCNSTILRLVQSGRSTFFCPTCQK